MASSVKAQPTILAGSVDQLVFAAGIGDHDFATIGEILVFNYLLISEARVEEKWRLL